MSKQTIIQSNQTLMDLVIQNYGNVEAYFDFIVANGISVTNIAVTGTKFNVPNSDKINREINEYFSKRSIHPATKTSQSITGFTDIIFEAPTISLNEVRVIVHQTLTDIALQETGTAESLVEFAVLNNISITDLLEVGTEINAKVNTQDIEILTYYKKHNIKPATADKIVVPIDTQILFAVGLFENGLFE